jgi:hypothetical protein
MPAWENAMNPPVIPLFGAAGGMPSAAPLARRRSGARG